jgi:hypothetical protein
MRRFRESLLRWEAISKPLHTCLRVRAHGHVCVPWHVGMCMRVRASSLAYPACNAYAPY